MDGYDYIIVGTGSAGAVIAARLLERTAGRVLLLEAGGPDDREEIHRVGIPPMISLWQDPSVTWPYATVPQPGLAGRTIPIPQGKVLGGGSSVNAMLYVRGNRRDFDHWNHLGNEGWAYSDVLPFFRRSEDFEDGGDDYRGVGGPLKVTRSGSVEPVSAAFIEAAKELGFEGGLDWDYNGARQQGGAFGYQYTKTKDRTRSSTAAAFLEPVLGHPRLTVATDATATRVLLDGTKATGVEYVRAGTVHQAAADTEVILSCGTFASPKLLMLSGIGPAEHLAEHGITPVVDLPGVGQNLQDHLILGVAYAARTDLGQPELLADTGLFTVSESGRDAASPDLQLLFGPVQFVEDSYRIDGPVFTFAPVLVQPQSRGHVALISGAPDAEPLVDPRYLECEEDLRVLVRGIELARELAYTSAMTPFRGRETAPGAVSDPRDLAAYVRSVATTVWHPVGTCRMGHDRMAVVDPQLRVHGVARLRVADASIMPTITAGNTNAASIMIGERAAELVTELV